MISLDVKTETIERAVSACLKIHPDEIMGQFPPAYKTKIYLMGASDEVIKDIIRCFSDNIWITIIAGKWKKQCYITEVCFDEFGRITINANVAQGEFLAAKIQNDYEP